MLAPVLAGAHEEAGMKRSAGNRQDIIHPPIIDEQADPQTVLFWVLSDFAGFRSR